MGTRQAPSRAWWLILFLVPIAQIALAAGPAVGEFSGTVSADLIVVFREGIPIAQRDAILSAAGAQARRHFHVISASSVSAADPAIRQRLIQHPDVVGVSANRTVSLAGKPGPGGGGEVIPSGVDRIGAPTAHLMATGAGVGVAVVDTGLDLSHPDLLIATPCFSAFVGISCQDNHGHGTRVGGIIAARKNALGVLGVAPDATLYAVKVFDATGQGTDETVIAGLEWIRTYPANPAIRVVNLSFYRDATPDDDIEPPIGLRAAVAALYAQGITVVAAAGDNLRHVSFDAPAGYPEVLAVAGTSARDGTKSSRCRTVSGILVKDTEAYLDNWGKFESGVGVTISAPSNDQLNLVATCAVDPTGLATTAPGGGVSTLGGTSAAAAHVSGVVALMWQKRLSSALPPEEARCIIRTTADRIGVAPIDAPAGLTVFPNESPAEKEGILWAPGAVSLAAATASGCP
jgi:subtilisin family serine protease